MKQLHISLSSGITIEMLSKIATNALLANNSYEMRHLTPTLAIVYEANQDWKATNLHSIYSRFYNRGRGPTVQQVRLCLDALRSVKHNGVSLLVDYIGPDMKLKAKASINWKVSLQSIAAAVMQNKPIKLDSKILSDFPTESPKAKPHIKLKAIGTMNADSVHVNLKGSDQEGFVQNLCELLTTPELAVSADSKSLEVESDGSFKFSAKVGIKKTVAQKTLEKTLTNLLHTTFGKRFVEASVGFTSDNKLEVSGHIRALALVKD